MKPWLRRLVCRCFDLVPSEFCADYGERMWDEATAFAAEKCETLRRNTPMPSGPIGDAIVEAFATCEAAIKGEKLRSPKAITKYFSPEARVEEQERWKEAHR